MPATKTRGLEDKLAEVNEQIESQREVAQTKFKAFEEARDQFAAEEGDPTNVESPAFEKAEKVHKEYAEESQKLGELEARRDGIFEMIAAEKSGRKPGGSTDPRAAQQAALEQARGGARRSLGAEAVESEGYQELLASGVLNSDHAAFNARLAEMPRDEVKAVLSPMAALLVGDTDTSAGAFVQNDVKGYVPQPRRMLKILDLITLGDTDSDTVEYVRQDTFANAAAETAEADDVDTGAKPEATLAFTKVTEATKTIAHWIPATRRALRDAGQLRTIIDSQLRYGLDLRVENQVVAGDGAGENIRGILNTTGILTQAKGTDSEVDAIHKGITQIRLGYIEPNGVGLHPNDWQSIRLSKNTDGDYYYGPPALAGTEMVWGLPVAVTAAVTENTGVVGDFRQAVLWMREAAQVLASDSHADFFVKNLVAILAELAAAFGVLMPKAFCKVTGI
jgi:HK97 family phage major capsid protein